MDTYFTINHKCTTCGDCIDACELDGLNFLTISTNSVGFEGELLPPMITGKCDYIPCHHCKGFWDNKTPCKIACKNNAIKISRW